LFLSSFFFKEVFFAFVFLAFIFDSEVFSCDVFFFDFLFLLLDVPVHEEVGEFVELAFFEFSLEGEDFAGEEPVDHGEGLLASVVAGDGAVDVGEVVIGVAEGDDGDVHVGTLDEGVVVDSGVGEDEESGLDELLGVLIGEHSGSPSAGHGHGPGVFGEFIDGSLSVESAGDGDDRAGVGDGCDDSGRNLDLLPLLLDVEHVHAACLFLPDVLVHLLGAAFSSQVAL
jgi:hypothetical protein